MNCRQVTREAAASDFLPKAARCQAELEGAVRLFSGHILAHAARISRTTEIAF
jgi:hypothetical protein